MRPVRGSVGVLYPDSAALQLVEIGKAPLIDGVVRVVDIHGQPLFVIAARRALGTRLRTETAISLAADAGAGQRIGREVDTINLGKLLKRPNGGDQVAGDIGAPFWRQVWRLVPGADNVLNGYHLASPSSSHGAGG